MDRWDEVSLDHGDEPLVWSPYSSLAGTRKNQQFCSFPQFPGFSGSGNGPIGKTPRFPAKPRRFRVEISDMRPKRVDLKSVFEKCNIPACFSSNMAVSGKFTITRSFAAQFCFRWSPQNPKCSNLKPISYGFHGFS